MKRTRSLGHAQTYLVRNWKFFFMTVLFLLGMLVGALLIRSGSTADNLSFIFDSFVGKRGESSFFQTFLLSFSSALLLLMADFFLGTSLIGVIGTPVVPLFRGLGLGASIGYLYAFYSWKGLAFSLVLILPHALISSFALVLASKDAFHMSQTFFSCALADGSADKIYPTLKRYLVRFIVYFFMICAASLLDALMSALFARFIVLT